MIFSQFTVTSVCFYVSKQLIIVTMNQSLTVIKHLRDLRYVTENLEVWKLHISNNIF